MTNKKILPIAVEKQNKASSQDIVSNLSAKDVAGTNILFINLPLRETASPNTTPEGPLLMATNLIQNFGVNASIIDLNAYRIKDSIAEERNLPNGRHITYDEAKDLIKKHMRIRGEPDVVALSGMITTLKWQKAVTEMVRDILPNVFIVSGNGLATELKLGLFNYIEELDAVAHSENGNKILEWYLSVPVWGGAANNSSAAPFSMNRSTTSVSSRGCPFACNFCYRGQQGERNWGVRSAEHIFKEILDHRDRYNIDFKGFPDDNFAVAIPRIEQLVPLLKPYNIKWGTHTRMDEGADPKRISPMAEAGCVYIGFGAETANEDSLIAINKGGHTLSNGFENIKVNGRTYKFPKSMTMAIRNCIDYGIHANCTWIMGIPFENLDRLKYSVAFIKWQEELYSKHGVSSEAVNKKMFTLTWYPGTGMIKYENVREQLSKIFGLTFKESGNKLAPYEPICDDAFYKYLIELDDATKVLQNDGGNLLNFGDMPEDDFVQAREHVDSGNLFKILDMK